MANRAEVSTSIAEFIEILQNIRSALEAVKAYTQAVKSREYPAAEHCF